MEKHVDRQQLSHKIIETCLAMNRLGINHGSSGNISHRYGDGMLITPTGKSFETMSASDIVFISEREEIEAGKNPSGEWHIHHAVLRVRPDQNAVIHTHGICSAVLAILNKGIPAIHFMVAAAGGHDIPCVPYATFGTRELAAHIAPVIKERDALLMQQHGLLAGGKTLAETLSLAEEVENLARIYVNLLQMTDKVPLLPDDEMDKAIRQLKP